MTVNFIKKIKDSLTKTRSELLGSLEKLLPFGAKITDEVLEEIEEVLFEGDLGIHAVDMIVSELKQRAAEINRMETDPYSVMKNTVLNIINRTDLSNKLLIGYNRPHVIIVVGVNGVGKTTTAVNISAGLAPA